MITSPQLQLYRIKRDTNTINDSLQKLEIMNTLFNKIMKNDIDSMLNSITVVITEINEDIKKIMLNIMTTFSTPSLQVAYA